MKNRMEVTFTLTVILSVLVLLAKGQEKNPKAKRPGLNEDSAYAYQVISNPGNPVMTTMPIDTVINGNVNMPNSYQKGGVEPVPMPTHRLKLIMLKKRQDSSAKNLVQPIPMPNRKSYPTKPKE